jgi:nucleoside-diphosphate-sugar epimerase
LVVHSAGVIAANRPEDYDRYNHRAVLDLMACIRRQSWVPRRLVFISSLAAAGPSPADGTPLTEDDPPAPRDPYGVAKWRALSRALDRRVLVVPVPRPALWLVSRAATAVTRVLPLRNQIDDKQYRQLIAPAFVCSSARLQRELGWLPRVDLHEAVRRTVDGYRADGWL